MEDLNLSPGPRLIPLSPDSSILRNTEADRLIGSLKSAVRLYARRRRPSLLRCAAAGPGTPEILVLRTTYIDVHYSTGSTL